MIKLAIPGRGEFVIEHVVLDYNGTLALDGKPFPGVSERIEKLSKQVHLHVLTADTFLSVKDGLSNLPCKIAVIKAGNREDEEKLAYVSKLGANRCVAIGNGANDHLMLAHVVVGICVIQEEGASLKTLQAADIVCRTINDALDLLIHPSRLVATLRGCKT